MKTYKVSWIERREFECSVLISAETLEEAEKIADDTVYDHYVVENETDRVPDFIKWLPTVEEEVHL